MIFSRAAVQRWSAALVPGFLLTAHVVATGQTASAPAGLYNEDQAIHGQQLYYTHCLSCHGEDMAGLDQAPPLAGPQFSSIWSGESLAALLQRIETMPPTAPESLSREEYVALLAYMLWYNGLPIGAAPLDTEHSVLAEQQFRPPKAQ